MKSYITTKVRNSYATGEYFEERKALHEDIAKQLLVGQPAYADKYAYVLGGGSGSGKSWLAKITIQAYKDAGFDIVHIDSDEIKTMLPEYKDMVEVIDGIVIPKNPDWADILHDESSDIATMVLSMCIHEERNCVFDGTMKNDTKYKRIIEIFKDHGYGLEINVADIDVEEAIKRVKEREKINGRHVPEEIVRESHRKVAQTFYLLKDMVENFTLFDTSREKPEPFAEKISNEENIIDPERLRQFYLKGGISFETEDRV